MTVYQIFVENIKCSGCMNSIKTALLKLNGVTDVSIDKETEAVSITGTDMQKNIITARLAALGYPEKGNNNMLHKAKSYVSCAVGRYDKTT